jgi:hypothetical protein
MTICLLHAELKDLFAMVIFFGGAGFQTLIQYQSRQSAIQAYGALHVGFLFNIQLMVLYM